MSWTKYELPQLSSIGWIVPSSRLSPCAEMKATLEHVHLWVLQGVLSSALPVKPNNLDSVVDIVVFQKAY